MTEDEEDVLRSNLAKLEIQYRAALRQLDVLEAGRCAHLFKLSEDGRDLLRADTGVRAGVLHVPHLGLCTQIVGCGRAPAMVSVAEIKSALARRGCDVL